MDGKSEAIVLWKNKGLTMGDVLKGFQKENPSLVGIPITYAGRLDPMAEGIVLLLVGDKRFDKEAFLKLPKTYTFECLWGVTTDTYDILGLVTHVSYKKPGEEEIQRSIRSLSSLKEQEYPAYSSRPVLGKPLFLWAREGKLSEIVVPKSQMEVFSLETTGARTVSSSALQKEIEDSISQVSGDFRQKEIISKWKEVLKKEETFLISQMEAKVSSGTYIRGLAHSLGLSLGSGALAMNIVRTQVGDIDRTQVMG